MGGNHPPLVADVAKKFGSPKVNIAYPEQLHKEPIYDKIQLLFFIAQASRPYNKIGIHFVHNRPISVRY